jgi:SAM-dependent methyltransferase
MIGRFFAWLRLYLARSVLCDIPARPSEGRSWLSGKIEYPDLAAVAAAGNPRLESYERLAPVYDAYSGASWWSAQYASYLEKFLRYHGRPMASLLDLGCGSGQFVVHFANRLERVVGLDSNPHMLALARKRWNDLPNVSFVEGDLRTFALDARFDAIICASDALNYAQSPSELKQALDRINQHLH